MMWDLGTIPDEEVNNESLLGYIRYHNLNMRVGVVGYHF